MTNQFVLWRHHVLRIALFHSRICNTFCFGEPFCNKWETSSWVEPPPERSKTESSINRFPKPCSTLQMNVICQECIPRYTDEATNWALKVFQSWREQRGEQQDGVCPVDDLLDLNNAKVKKKFDCRVLWWKHVTRRKFLSSRDYP